MTANRDKGCTLCPASIPSKQQREYDFSGPVLIAAREETHTATLAEALCPYGTKIGDDRLVAACAYTRTSIVAPPESDFPSRCSDLLDEATPIVNKLGKFKVTPATLTALQAKIDAFDAVRMSPRDAIKQSKAATNRLPKLFRKMRVLLSRRLDPLIAPFKETNPELWSEYKTARKLVNLPTTAAKKKSKPDSAASESKAA